jgi:hypothetical protein
MEIIPMKNPLILALSIVFLCTSFSGLAQKKKKGKEPETVAVKTDSVAVVAAVPKDTVVIKDTTLVKDTTAKAAVADTAVVVTPKDCFQDWYEKMRARGANPVTDGMHPVVITLKSESSGVCMMGKIQVTNGKIVPPLMVQLEDGEYQAANLMGKKLDPEFTGNISEEELYKVTDGMSILFRTASQEYGRLIFYTFAKKGANANKVAPSPDELIKD